MAIPSLLSIPAAEVISCLENHPSYCRLAFFLFQFSVQTRSPQFRLYYFRAWMWDFGNHWLGCRAASEGVCRYGSGLCDEAFEAEHL